MLFYFTVRSRSRRHSCLICFWRLIFGEDGSDRGQFESAFAEGTGEILLVGPQPVVDADPAEWKWGYQKRCPQGVTMGLLATSIQMWHWYLSSIMCNDCM